MQQLEWNEYQNTGKNILTQKNKQLHGLWGLDCSKVSDAAGRLLAAAALVNTQTHTTARDRLYY